MGTDDRRSEWKRRYEKSVADEKRRHPERDRRAERSFAGWEVVRVVIFLVVGACAAVSWATTTSDPWLELLAGAFAVLAIVAAVGMVIGWYRS